MPSLQGPFFSVSVLRYNITIVTIPNFKGEIESGEEELSLHSTDASVFKVRPRAVLYPTHVSDVVAAINYVRGEKRHDPTVSLSVRAGGTCMSGGSLNTGYILNMTRHMNKVEVDPHLGTATVEMGAYFRDIESKAAEHGLMFAPYPSSHLICGIGGMIGNNASGEKSIRFGATIDNVLSLTVVLADGSVLEASPKELSLAQGPYEEGLLSLGERFGEHFRMAMGQVSKAASGYRFDRIIREGIFNPAAVFVGAQGTLGIVVAATLKMVPLPTHTELLIISVDTLTHLPRIVELLMQHNPEGVETFDRNTYLRAREHMGEDAQVISQCMQEGTSLVVLAQFSEQSVEATRAQAEACAQALKVEGYAVHFITDASLAAAAWRVRRSSFSLMRDHNKEGFRAVPCIEDVIIPLPSLATFLEGLIPLLEAEHIEYGYHGHIGDGSLRIIPVFDFNDPEVASKIITFTRAVLALVKSVGGNMSADHSDGIIRTPFLKEFYGEDLVAGFSELKQLFDPEGIFNPNKKVGGTEDHIRIFLNR